jgi:hypothetical protein
MSAAAWRNGSPECPGSAKAEDSLQKTEGEKQLKQRSAIYPVIEHRLEMNL